MHFQVWAHVCAAVSCKQMCTCIWRTKVASRCLSWSICFIYWSDSCPPACYGWSPVSTSWMLPLHRRHHTVWVLVGSGNPNPGPHTCAILAAPARVRVKQMPFWKQALLWGQCLWSEAAWLLFVNPWSEGNVFCCGHPPTLQLCRTASFLCHLGLPKGSRI